VFRPFVRGDAVPEALPRHAFPGACRASFTHNLPQRKKRSRWGLRRVLRSKTFLSSAGILPAAPRRLARDNDSPPDMPAVRQRY
jgi:hypothetical protein